MGVFVEMMSLVNQYKDLAVGAGASLAGTIMFLKMKLKSTEKDVERLDKKIQLEIKEIKEYVDIKHKDIKGHVDDKHKEFKEQVLDLKAIIRSGFDKLENRIYDLSKREKEQ